MSPARRGHRIARVGWLRAAVLGANDGIISTSSLMLGFAASNAGSHGVLLAGVAGLAAGALSMATGEYVSVSSQADTERAALDEERDELNDTPDAERRELAAIYVGRGLDPQLARQVAEQLTARDALGAHARDELGISEPMRARPVQAAASSAVSFSAGAAIPLLAALAAPAQHTSTLIACASLASLALLGGWAAQMGGARPAVGALRVVLWSALAMAVTFAVGALSGV